VRHLALVTACALLLAAGAAVSGRTAAPAGVTWGHRHFASKHALAAWLAARGVTYRAWAARHPHGAHLLTHPKPKPEPVRVVPPVLRLPLTQQAGGSHPAGYVLPLVLLLVLVGLLPLRRLAESGRAVPDAVLTRALEIRAAAFASAAVLVLGLLLTRVFG
jgi:hypothetical protein